MAKVTDKELKELLLEELEGKKPFNANWLTECSLCGSNIEEGDEFFFFGDKKKICTNCRILIQTTVEEQL